MYGSDNLKLYLVTLGNYIFNVLTIMWTIEILLLTTQFLFFSNSFLHWIHDSYDILIDELDSSDFRTLWKFCLIVKSMFAKKYY
jgi:hypothetical protein